MSLKTKILGVAVAIGLLLPAYSYASSIPSGLTFSSDTHGEMALIQKNVNESDTLIFGFTVTNTYDHNTEYYLYPSDVVTKIGGGWVYKKEVLINSRVGSWYVKPIKTKFYIDAGETQSHEFTIEVPDSLKDGEYISGVVLSEVIDLESLDSNSSDNLLHAGAKEIGIIKPIHIVLNHNVDKGVSNVYGKGAVAFSDIPDNGRPFSDSTGLFMIDLEFENIGTVRGKISGTYKITRNETGEIIEENTYSMDDIYADTVGIYRIVPNGGYLPKGSYLLEWTAGSESFNHEFTVDGDSAKDALNELDNTSRVIVQESNNLILVCIFSGIICGLLFIIFIIWRKKKKKENTEEFTEEKVVHVD